MKKTISAYCRKSFSSAPFSEKSDETVIPHLRPPTVIGGVELGNTVHDDDYKFTQGLREYVDWGGNPIGGVSVQIAMFGEPRVMCSAQGISTEKFDQKIAKPLDGTAGHDE